MNLIILEETYPRCSKTLNITYMKKRGKQIEIDLIEFDEGRTLGISAFQPRCHL